MSETPPIHGTCDPQFERVREVFAENFERRSELGAGVAVTLNGKMVVDLWGGHLDSKKATPWERDTLVNVYSTTKGITALCAHRLADQGLLDFDAPVAKYWPEFAAEGKENIPVRWLLSHEAGLPAVRKVLPAEHLFEFETMAAHLAAEKPWWEPGTKHGYHAVTFGWLVGEVIRRISGKTPGAYFASEIGGPLKADFHIGMDASMHGRVGRMKPAAMGMKPPAGQPDLMSIMMKDPTGVTGRAFMNPPSMVRPGVVNTPEWRSAELPAANGHATARALATVYGCASGADFGGYRIFSDAQLPHCCEEQVSGPDEVLTIDTRISLGFMMSQDRPCASFGAGERNFGHPGAGGSVAFADPDAKIGFGYVMNRMGASIIIDERPDALMTALYECL